ncbi:trans-acting enoyl reductase family protein [Thalassococcus sp. S3]|uniref:saccharopine dehydrogenase family protein n=1 Tax=Thalassococcus sp. S3 TaxID=2017482 RepID=UPI001024692D|nr:saccharopine dehydrogenase NADP-binding domain-containing protein [Thalassococcus sp. S3]QBF31556.1 saccharopine dehydrogenase [Thalassococcus sp. S3]
MSELDVIIYGATGYTGGLVAEYMNQTYPNRSWGIAGRNKAKLEHVKSDLDLPDHVVLIEADASDPASLNAMVQRARVIITTVGPYQHYGEPLVAACARYGTDYVDLCGEPPFMWSSIETYDEMAKASGARIVHSCGFDSVPSDLGVLFLQTEAKTRFGAPLKDVRCRVRSMVGKFSGGTAASGRATEEAAKADPAIMARLISPFALTPGFEGARQPTGHKPYEDEKLGAWVTPFFMAPVNTKNVHRSNALMNHLYGTDFTYEEMILTGSGDAGKAMATHIATSDPLAGQGYLNPGEGPTREERESGSYDFMIYGDSEGGERLVVGVTGDRDPGYGSTCKMLTECAICLLDDVADAPGGVLTPAPIFGPALIGRLEANAGLTFKVED